MSARALGGRANGPDDAQAKFDFDQCDAGIDSRIAFARGSSATRFTSAGLLASVASGAPRIAYDPATLARQGLLIEGQSTNVLLHASNYGAANWVKSELTVTTGATLAPDGISMADALVESTTTNAFHYLAQIAAKPSSVAEYTASAMLKDKGRQALLYLTDAVASGAYVLVDLTNGAVTTAATIFGTFSNAYSTVQPCGSGWYQVSITATTTALGTIVGQVTPHNGTSALYTGNGTSGVYAWGLQVNAGKPTSYIPTTTAQATRAADSATINGAALASIYGQAQGTLFVQWSGAPTDSARPLLVARKDDSNYRLQLTTGNAAIVNNGMVQASLGDGVNRAAGKAALAYADGDFELAINGTLYRATSGTLPTGISTLTLGHFDFGGLERLDGTLVRVHPYTRRLRADELYALTV